MKNAQVSPNRFAWLRRLFCILLALCLTPAMAEEKDTSHAEEYVAEFSSLGQADNLAPALDYFVDFRFLKSVNADAVAWLRTEDGAMNHPVFQAKDNKYYMKRNMIHRASSDGEIFLDCASDQHFTEDVWYLYGSTSNEGPLSNLQNMLGEGVLESHPGLILMTPDGNYTAEFFAAYPTNVGDETSWRIDTTSPETFAASMDTIRGFEGAVMLEERLPAHGEKLLVLNTHVNTKLRRREVLFARLTPCAPTPENAKDLNKIEMDSRETLNGYVDIEGVGRYMLYAQDDPMWGELRYERNGSKKVRRFEQGGCGPTAVAIALANLLTPEELTILSYYADDPVGFSFCSCSVNNYRCNLSHAQYHPETPEEFLRYLPIILANYAAGNNEYHKAYRTESQGTNMEFLQNMVEIFKLKCTYTRYAPDALEMIKEGKGTRIAVCTAVRGSPFTNSGHFIILAYVDDEYAYYLDPLRENNYEKYYKSRVLEMVAPGVVRVKVDAATNIDVSPYYILEK